MRLLRAHTHRAMPWKNGGGVTHEIAVWPEGAGMEDFTARLSMAEVAANGPFSRFDGVDRVLTLIEGAGIALAFTGGGEVALTPGAAPFAFPGEAAVTGRLIAGPILDLNVMVRRGRATARVERLSAGQTPDGATALIATGPATFAGETLTRGDTILHPPPVPLDGEALAVWLTL